MESNMGYQNLWKQPYTVKDERIENFLIKFRPTIPLTEDPLVSATKVWRKAQNHNLENGSSQTVKLFSSTSGDERACGTNLNFIPSNNNIIYFSFQK